MARSCADDDDNISSDHHKADGNICCPWAPRASSHRQRASIHQPSLLAKIWCDSYPGGPLSPIIERPGRKSSQTFKQALKWDKKGTLEERLYRFLLNYRLTPYATAGQAAVVARAASEVPAGPSPPRHCTASRKDRVRARTEGIT